MADTATVNGKTNVSTPAAAPAGANAPAAPAAETATKPKREGHSVTMVFSDAEYATLVAFTAKLLTNSLGVTLDVGQGPICKAVVLKAIASASAK